MNTIKTSLVATTLIAALALTGCVQNPDLEPWAIGTPPVTEPSGEPTEGGEVIELPENAQAGDTITAEQAEAINRNRDDGLKGYELPDGTFVLVVQDEPLPPAVKADAEAKADALPIASGTSVESQQSTIASNNALGAQLSIATGKQIVVISYGSIALRDLVTVTQAWKASNIKDAQGYYPTSTNLDALIAEVNALIAQQSNPAEWEIVVQ